MAHRGRKGVAENKASPSFQELGSSYKASPSFQELGSSSSPHLPPLRSPSAVLCPSPSRSPLSPYTGLASSRERGRHSFSSQLSRSASEGGGSGGGLFPRMSYQGSIRKQTYTSATASTSSPHYEATHTTAMSVVEEEEEEEERRAGGGGGRHGRWKKVTSTKGRSLGGGIFRCWSKKNRRINGKKHVEDEEEEGDEEDDEDGEESRVGVGKFAAMALVEENRRQQEALAESQDMAEMWEWQMEQQEELASYERHLGEVMLAENPLGVVSLKEEGEKERKVVSNSSSFTTATTSTVMELEMVAAIARLFEYTLLRYRTEVNLVARVLMQQLGVAGYSLIATLSEMEPHSAFERRSHSALALEARLHGAFFRCFENDSFDDTGLTRIFDPATRSHARLGEYLRLRLTEPELALRPNDPAYDPAFHSFCADKSEEVLAMFPNAVTLGYQRDRFTRAFLNAAKWVWLLHRLANALHPRASVFRVGKGSLLDTVYLESACRPSPRPSSTCPNCPTPKVEFMIVPGFLISSSSHGLLSPSLSPSPSPSTSTPPSSPSFTKVIKSLVYQHYLCK